MKYGRGSKTKYGWVFHPLQAPKLLALHDVPLAQSTLSSVVRARRWSWQARHWSLNPPGGTSLKSQGSMGGSASSEGAVNVWPGASPNRYTEPRCPPDGKCHRCDDRASAIGTQQCNNAIFGMIVSSRYYMPHIMSVFLVHQVYTVANHIKITRHLLSNFQVPSIAINFIRKN